MSQNHGENASMLTHMQEPEGARPNMPQKAPIAIFLTRDESGLTLRSSDPEGLKIYRVWEIELGPGETAAIELGQGKSALTIEYTENDYTKEGILLAGPKALVLQAVEVQYEVWLIEPEDTSAATLIRVKSKGQGDDLTAAEIED